MSTQQQSPDVPAQLAALRGFDGTSAGSMFSAVWQEYAAVKADNRGDRQQVVTDLLARLHSTDLISTKDAEQLRYVSDSVFARTRGELAGAELSDRIRSTHDAVAADTDSSPIAVAVLGILTESNAMSAQARTADVASVSPVARGNGTEFVPEVDPGSIALFSSSVPTMVADEEIILEAALFGAGAGAFFGGPVGGVVGGVLGTIIGGFIAVIDAIT